MSNVLSDSQVQAVAATTEDRKYKLARFVCCSVYIGFALLEAWSTRQFINPDGISYLDMSDALLKHNWRLLINPLWSPLYPFLIGVATWITRPSAQWELPIVHMVNLVIFLGALWSFDFLLRQVICVLGRKNEHLDADSTVPLPAWMWQLLGYSLFAWSTFELIWAPTIVTPDLCVAMFVYLDAGIVLSLRTSAKKSRTCLLLGITLGLGYLAKAILFPMAFVFMVVAFLVIGEWRKAVCPLAITLVMFCALSAPLFSGISLMVGRPSFSEAGNLNIAWKINGAESVFYSSCPPPYLKHPMNLLYKRPNVFDFKESLVSTYPPYFDPQHWNAGTKIKFDLRSELGAIKRNMSFYFAMPLVTMWGVIGAGGILLMISGNMRSSIQNLPSGWALLIPGIVGTCVYLPVWVEPRYVAPFIVLVLLGLFPIILSRRTANAAKRSAITIIAIAGSMTLLTLLVLIHRGISDPVFWARGGYDQAAEVLNEEGLHPGENTAVIGSGVEGMIWARLARVRIVAQIPLEYANDFWRASDPRTKAEVYDAFVRAGAKAVVTEETPPDVGFADWHRVGNTRYFVHFLAQSNGK